MNRHTFVGMMLLLGLFHYTVAAEVNLFGPETFTRTSSLPQAITRSFAVADLSGPFKLNVQTGEGQRGRPSSAVIRLNGAVVVGPDEFSKRADIVTKALTGITAQNELSVEVRSEPGTYLTITITGPGTALSPISGIAISPDAFLVGATVAVTIHAHIPYSPSGPPPNVTLERLDSGNNVIGVEGALVDNGNLTAGDDVQGDGVFSMRKSYTSDVQQRFRFRITSAQGTSIISSGTFFLDALTPINDTQFASITSLQQNAQQHFYDLIATRGRQAATNSTLALITADPTVLQAGISDGGTGIWILYADGILGGLLLNDPGTLAGPSQAISTGVATPAWASSTIPLPEALKSGDIEAGNSKVLLLSPFYSSLSAVDVNASLKTLFDGTTCPKYDVTYLKDNAVTIEAFKTLSQYGVVKIRRGRQDSTHRFAWFSRGRLLTLPGRESAKPPGAADPAMAPAERTPLSSLPSRTTFRSRFAGPDSRLEALLEQAAKNQPAFKIASSEQFVGNWRAQRSG